MIVAAMMMIFDDGGGGANHGGVPQELVSYNPVTSEWVTRASMLVPRFPHHFHFSKSIVIRFSSVVNIEAFIATLRSVLKVSNGRRGT